MRLPPLVAGTLLRRYQRFLADVRLEDGSEVTAHCPNTGSMLGCKTPGSRVWLSRADNPERKLAWTWELVEARPGVLVGLHTGRTNALVREAIEAGRIPGLADYGRIRQEVKYGEERSRIDLLLEAGPLPDCYVEVKNVTAVAEPGDPVDAVAEGGSRIGYFPDAVSTRGAKHLRELSAMVRQGKRAVIFYCVQRGDIDEVRPADHIDPAYGEALRAALAAGVEAVALGADPDPGSIHLLRPLRVVCP